MLDKHEKLDFSKMRPVLADCSRCPFPSWRERDLCTLCATLMVDKDGVRHVNPQPLLSDDDIREDRARKKEIRGRRKGATNGKH